jgi:hypothetical protein
MSTKRAAKSTRKSLAEALASCAGLIKASLCQPRIKCGKPTCRCAKSKRFRHVVLTFTYLPLSQMQVQCSVCEKKMFISRPLLGIERYQSMSSVTEKILALTRVLATFRVSEKILGLFGVAFNRMKVWRCVQKVGKAIPPEAYPLSAEKSGKISRI